jgi:hypothetical protein
MSYAHMDGGIEFFELRKGSLSTCDFSYVFSSAIEIAANVFDSDDAGVIYGDLFWSS